MRFRIFAFAAAFLMLCGCGGVRGPAETVDPYEGMVQVESGFGTKMWVELYEDVPVSTFDAADFAKNGQRASYTGGGFDTRWGIDVSEHQGLIDWKAVAADGVEFAMIRAGYRGYSQGGLYTDEYFLENILLARENGIDVGLYFFSQAVTTEEAVEEAEYLLGLLDEIGLDVKMPVAFDWEHIGSADARTDDVDGATLTDCAVAFCERVKLAGHDPVVYAYRNLAYFIYELPRLNDYALWMGALGDWPDFYYKHEIWQYSADGRVAGIDGPVDLNLYFEERNGGAGEPGAGDVGEDKQREAEKADAMTPAQTKIAAASTLAESRAEYFAADAADCSYAWPCASSSHIISKFGYISSSPYRAVKYHSGVDIDADDGAAVSAAANGDVKVAEYDSSYGNYVVLSHSDHTLTLYAHMSSLAVSEGDAVSQGDTIGYVGSTGNAAGPHLHFEVRVDGEYVDPLQYFGGMSFSFPEAS